MKSFTGFSQEIKNNLRHCIDEENLFMADADPLSEATVDGSLKTRADAGRHQGDFRKIVI
ncbi:MAG: hypothetical protein AB2L14_29305 [Candidatus Xenobiia bacterium LiM19]